MATNGAATKYSIDSSTLIEASNRYPFDVIPGVWEALDDLAERGRLLVSEEVLAELECRDDELNAWVKQRDHVLVRHDNDVQLAVRRILTTHTTLFDLRKNKSGADPSCQAI